MPTKIGPFEILSELAKSSTCTVYKANDPQSGQTVALKAIQLSAFGDKAPALEKSLLEEAERSKVLSSSNITPVYGAGEIEGKFCAAMEYVQGNSIATMLARKEGFSIWDLLDIGRQVCNGLDHAHGHKLFHYSLEPSKIMCGWDGTVKILSFGISSVGNFAPQTTDGVPSILYYMSPEQVHGEEITAQSNLFSLGAMFHEMVTDRRAFQGATVDTVCQSIVETIPDPPIQLNPKIHPLLSDLIIKALSKDPAQRYASGRALLDDLEKCKDSRSQAAAKSPAPAKGVVVPDKVKAAAASKFVAATQSKPAAAAPTRPVATSVAKPATAAVNAPPAKGTSAIAKPQSPQTPKAAAAGAGAPTSASPAPKEANAPNEFSAASFHATIDAAAQQEAPMSSAVADEPVIETFDAPTPNVAVDPLMAEGGPSRAASTSFSEIAEMPPLKEIYIAPPPPPAQPEISLDPVSLRGRAPEKPKVQPREVAHKAMNEIKSVPPRLLMYSVTGAIALILLIGLAIAAYIHFQNADDDNGSSQSVSSSAPEPEPAKKAATHNHPAQPAPEVAATEPEAQPAEVEETAAPAAAAPRGRPARKRVAAEPVVVPGRVVVDSTPQGAQVQIDAKIDPAWVTPYTMAGLAPGQHTIAVSKSGYTTDTRTIDVASGNKALVTINLKPVMATLSVSTSPAGANVYVDGKDSGKLTPAQFSLDKGAHTILLRKAGYLDETASSQLVQGEIARVASTLRPLGNVDDIKTTGKFKKMFGGKGTDAGMGTVSIKTQPKGAQVAVNQHMLEKATPVEFLLDPGNYIIDITMSGYAPVRKVITVDRSGKITLDESLQRE
jgi:eukaryotic-like serine/threonine-protein kinase